ncbi:unnamed protein product [Pedinophyceae sp. YPF-701]|nr:unnamed protein product [Pedinophyceae sp. YPF-701]
MLFGELLDEAASTRMLNEAWEAGIDAFDSAEMYPVPQRVETSGESERILGRWLKTRPRDRAVVCTKIAGPGGMDWIRGGPVSLSPADIAAAIEGSLQRLGTDHIDLIQIHWPDRYVPMFGEVEYRPELAYTSVSIEDQYDALTRAVDAGKVRYVGLSNETPWGVAQWTRLHEDPPSDTPPIVALQNAYNLLCRTHEAGTAEACHATGVSLLAYSPLAMGLLSGKYLQGAIVPRGPSGPSDGPGFLCEHGGRSTDRLNRYRGRYAEAESRYGARRPVVEATREYVRVAGECGVSPTELALRWVLGRPGVAAAVIGASDNAQLRELVAAAEGGRLPDGVVERIDAVHRAWPNPCP